MANFVNPSAETLWLTKVQYDSMSEKNKADFVTVRDAIPTWDALGPDAHAAVAATLINEHHTPATLIPLIQSSVNRHAGESATAEFGWGVLLANEIRYGVELRDRYADSPHGSIVIDDAKDALKEVPGLADRRSFADACAALDKLLGGAVTPKPLPVTDLPKTTDPVEIAARMRQLPPIWPAGNSSNRTAEDVAASTKALAPVKAKKANADIAPEVFEFKAAFGMGDELDVELFHKKTWEEFCAVIAGPFGPPSGIA